MRACARLYIDYAVRRLMLDGPADS